MCSCLLKRIPFTHFYHTLHLYLVLSQSIFSANSNAYCYNRYSHCYAYLYRATHVVAYYLAYIRFVSCICEKVCKDMFKIFLSLSNPSPPSLTNDNRDFPTTEFTDLPTQFPTFFDDDETDFP